VTRKHRYTAEQIDYIKSIAVGLPVEDIQEAFNEKFNLQVTFKSIKGIMYRQDIKNRMQGYNTRFQEGHKPWNKNKKGLQLGGEASWFKKGDPHPQQKPVGSESIHEGILWIKVDQPNVWRKKHHYIWEQAYGSIPDNKVLRFKDGNKENCTLDNLFLTTREAMTSVVRSGREYNNPELNVTSHRIAELDMRTREVSQ